MTTRRTILIAGPTASGKSALALELARQTGGVIVNADSMQVYDVLDRLTARPKAAELAAVRHLLYGHVSPLDSYSTGRWLREVTDILRDSSDDLPLIFVGGTGLYFRALTHGLSAMPDVPADVRAAWRERLAETGAMKLHKVLQARDPLAASTIRPTDGQRIVRALEVWTASRRSIVDWQAASGHPPVDPSAARRILLMPDRAELHRRIEHRFRAMVEEGAAEEVRRLLDMSPDPALPAMKAIGVRELGAWIGGRWSKEQAIDAATIATRQYAKRQMTWFRNQLDGDWTVATSVQDALGAAAG